jgi:serpin B
MFEFLRRLMSKPKPVEPVVAPRSTDREPLPLAAAMNSFALTLWPKVAPPASNAVFSPGSLWLALAMTTTGANGETRAELARLLRLPDDPTALDAAVHEQLLVWETSTLKVVNRLFLEQGVTFEAAWLEASETHWRAPAERVPFAHDADGARRHVNAWVERQTAEQIRELLPSGSVDADTRLVLVNAVHFLARWHIPFEKHLTQPAPFFDGTSEHPVPMMRSLKTFGYAAVEGAQAVQLDYADSDVKMLIVLPTAREGLAELERTLTAPKLEGWSDALTPTFLDLSLPRFRVEPTRSLELKTVLQSLGVELAFERERADFTGIAKPASPDERLSIGQVFHQAFVRVDEEGTEAAAATAVLMTLAGGMMQQPEPIVVLADHPFLFFLRDAKTSAWLFMGRMQRPT